MKEINVKTNVKYDILIGENIIENQVMIRHFPAFCKKAAIIWDETINPETVENVGAFLESQGTECLALSVEGGEKCKTLETYQRIIMHLLNFKFDKSDLIISVGGGSVSDLSGFVASTYMRGVKTVNIPTTLLAAADASVGGKNALNYGDFKNVIGTFHQPALVVIDTSILRKLPEKIFRAGTAEILKIAFISDKELSETLKERPLFENRDDIEYLENVIYRAVSLKASYVEEDEFNCGKRNMLNFGHTFGHAIEAVSRYKISHGEAVALGMVLISKIAESGHFEGHKTEAGTTENLIALLKANGLKTEMPFGIKTLTDAVIHDKKVSGDEITLVLPVKAGEAVLKNVSLKDLRSL